MVNKKIETLIREKKNETFSRCRNNSCNLTLKSHLKFLQENLNTSIESSRQIYYSRITNKLNNMQKNSKNYWFLLKIFLNKKKYCLYLFILRKSFHNRHQDKVRTFKLFFFSKQCSYMAKQSNRRTIILCNIFS